MKMTNYGHDELYHYGILGMRWGRRKESVAGSGSKISGKVKNTKKNNLSDDAKEAYKLKRKMLSEMSNAELKKLNERTNLERNYKQNNPGALKTGMAIAGTVAAALGTVVALYSNGHKIIKIGQAIVKKAATK